MKKILSMLLILSLTACLFSGCARGDKGYVPTGDALLMEGEEPPENVDSNAAPQEFSLVYYGDRNLNPLQSTDFTNRALFSLIYQGLFFVDRSYNAVPVLCKSFQVSPDNKTYTYYIEDATFSDGSTVTVEDVYATYMAAKSAGFFRGRFTHVRGIEITDDRAIQFTLATPFQNFSLLLDIPILKESQVEAERPLGSGPYILTESLAGSQLRRNMSWWCSDIPIAINAESIPLIRAQGDTFIRDQFEFGDVGIVCANPCSDSYADYRCDYELWDCDNGVMLYLGFNMNYSVDDIFKEPTLRSAFTYAIDRQRIVDDYYNGMAQPAVLAASPRSPYYSNTLAESYGYDSMRFIQVLSRIKRPKDPLRLIVNKDDSMRMKVADDIASTLTDYGLPTEVKAYDSNNYAAVFYAGNYDLYLGQVRLSPNMDLSSFFGPAGSLHYNGTDDAATYSLCKDALANAGNYYNLHQRVVTDGRIVPILFQTYNVYALRGLVTDLAPSRDCVFFYSLGKTLSDIQIPTDYNS